MKLRLAVLAVAAVVPLAAAAVPGSAVAAPASGQVFVLQGIADQTAAVMVDGRTIASSVAPRTVVGPVSVTPGKHTVQLRRGSDPIAQASFTAAAGSSTDLVAHRFPDVNRAPSFTAFTNDESPVPPGKTRLRVAHTAVVPPADIIVNGSVLIRNIANGESSTLVVPKGSYEVSIVPTATKGPAVLGPTTLQVKAGTLTNVFAIGDPAAGTMDAIVQQLPVRTSGSSAPSRVNTGDGGQAAGLFAENRAASGPSGRTTAVLAALAALAAIALLGSRPLRARVADHRQGPRIVRQRR